jgi:Protein of unknown function (DUF4232)
MRFRTSMAMLSAVAATGLTMAGCTSAASTSTSAGTPAATSASAAQAVTTPAAATPAASTPAAPPSSAPAQTAAAANPAAANPATCQTANLSYALGARTGSSAQLTQHVLLTNNGSSPCTLSGFPGVDLIGVANGQQNYRWPLERQVVPYSRVTLQPKGTAHFDLIYLPAAPGDGTNISVDTLVITPPSDFTQAELTWDQTVLLQDGATHPGTYISPVMPGQ